MKVRSSCVGVCVCVRPCAHVNCAQESNLYEVLEGWCHGSCDEFVQRVVDVFEGLLHGIIGRASGKKVRSE